MTPDAVSAFRSLFRLRDLECSDAAQVLHLVELMIQWRTCQTREPDRAHDALLGEAVEDCLMLRHALIVYLATLDPEFFRLNQRMAARSVARGEDLPWMIRQMIAVLVEGQRPPMVRQSRIGRDLLVVIAVQVAKWLGLSPMTSTAARRPETGCGRLMGVTGSTYPAVEKIWKRRFDVLMAAGFPQEDVSDFLR